MIVVVADTTPLNYLILLGLSDLLQKLFGHILVPPAVIAELSDRGAPPLVAQWTANPPNWLEVRQPVGPVEDLPLVLGAGEREALALAERVKADLLLLDDREARTEAHRRGLRVLGTLGVLERSAQLGLIPLPKVVEQLQRTNFRIPSALLKQALQADADRRRGNS